MILVNISLDDRFDSTENFHQDYVKVWKAINPQVEFSVTSTIEEALERAREIGHRGLGMQTLVTGSLYLVGGTLTILEPTTSTAASKSPA